MSIKLHKNKKKDSEGRVETVNICDSIKKRYIRLSKGQRKVAQFVIDNPNIIASQIASEVGRLAGVSESTVIRFCYAMDLSGFSELQDKMKAYLIESGEMPIVKQRAPRKKQAISSQQSIVQTIVEATVTADTLIKQAAQAIQSSQAIYVIGFRQAVPAALWLFNELTSQRDHVYFIQHDAENIARSLAAMDEQSLLFTVVFDEKFEDVETVMTIAKRKNVQMITLCNQCYETAQQSTIQLSADKLLDIPNKVAVFALLYTLTEQLTEQSKKSRKPSEAII